MIHINQTMYALFFLMRYLFLAGFYTLLKTSRIMAILTLIPGVSRVITGLPRCRGAIMAGIARPGHIIVIHADTGPA